jgi:hypothetical protein
MSHEFALSPEELAQLGAGALSYIREMASRDVAKIVGAGALAQVPPDAKLFCLFNATGQPISVSGTLQMAEDSAEEHDLIAISLH